MIMIQAAVRLFRDSLLEDSGVGYISKATMKDRNLI